MAAWNKDIQFNSLLYRRYWSEETRILAYFTQWHVLVFTVVNINTKKIRQRVKPYDWILVIIFHYFLSFLFINAIHYQLFSFVSFLWHNNFSVALIILSEYFFPWDFVRKALSSFSTSSDLFFYTVSWATKLRIFEININRQWAVICQLCATICVSALLFIIKYMPWNFSPAIRSTVFCFALNESRVCITQKHVLIFFELEFHWVKWASILVCDSVLIRKNTIQRERELIFWRILRNICFIFHSHSGIFFCIIVGWVS